MSTEGREWVMQKWASPTCLRFQGLHAFGHHGTTGLIHYTPGNFQIRLLCFSPVHLIGILDREPWLQNRVERGKEEIFCTHKKSTAKSNSIRSPFYSRLFKRAPKSGRGSSSIQKVQLASLGPGCWRVFHCTMTGHSPISTANLIWLFCLFVLYSHSNNHFVDIWSCTGWLAII